MAAEKLTWLENFVSNNYSKQSPWVRTIVFLAFAFLLVLSIYRVTSGDFDLKGRVLEQVSATDLHVPSNWYEVQLGAQSFGVCRNGNFQIILTSVEYVEAVASGTLSVKIFLPSGGVTTRDLKVHRVGYQDLDDVIIPVTPVTAHAAREMETLPAASARPPVHLPWLPVFHVFAMEPPRLNAKLMVEAVSMAASASSAREIDVSLATASGAYKPLLLKPANDPSGAVTVVPGKTVSYNEDHYFSLDSAPPSQMPLSGAIKISSKRGWLLSDYTENFALPDKIGYGDTFNAAGSNGSHIRLRLVYPWVVQIFDRADLPGGVPAMKQALLDRGFDSVSAPAPLGATADTNALWAGTSIPYTAVQAIVGVLHDQGVRLKKIEYRYAFEKSPGPDKIELGGSRATAAAPEIAPERIARILSATSEADFKAALACCEPGMQQQQAPRRRVMKK